MSLLTSLRRKSNRLFIDYTSGALKLHVEVHLESALTDVVLLWQREGKIENRPTRCCGCAVIRGVIARHIMNVSGAGSITADSTEHTGFIAAAEEVVINYGPVPR